MMGLQATIFDRLEPLPEAVKAQWSQHAGLAFDLTPEWFSLLYGHVLEENFEPRTVVISNSGGEPLCVVPLALTKEPVLPFGIRRLRSLSNYYTSAFDLVPLQAEIGLEVIEELGSCLAGMGSEADFIELEPVVRDDWFFREAGAALGRRGYILAPYRRFSNWFHDVPGQTFDEYLQGRDGALRNTYIRKEKKLGKRGYELEIVRRPADVDSAFAQYDAVYRRSWKISESHPHFIREVCRSFAERDWLRLGLLRVDGTPIAAQIWFVKEGTASIFKLSYDEEFKSLSAGTILSMALLKHVIDIDKVRKIDYLTGDDAYKTQYMSRYREMWCLRAYRKASLAGLFGTYESSKSVLRRWLRGHATQEVT